MGYLSTVRNLFSWKMPKLQNQFRGSGLVYSTNVTSYRPAREPWYGSEVQFLNLGFALISKLDQGPVSWSESMGDNQGDNLLVNFEIKIIRHRKIKFIDSCYGSHFDAVSESQGNYSLMTDSSDLEEPASPRRANTLLTTAVNEEIQPSTVECPAKARRRWSFSFRVVLWCYVESRLRLETLQLVSITQVSTIVFFATYRSQTFLSQPIKFVKIRHWIGGPGDRYHRARRAISKIKWTEAQ